MPIQFIIDPKRPSHPNFPPGTRVRMTEDHKVRFHRNPENRSHLKEFGECTGTVEGYVDWGSQLGPELDVRWQPSNLRYCYHPSDLEVTTFKVNDRVHIKGSVLVTPRKGTVTCLAHCANKTPFKVVWDKFEARSSYDPYEGWYGHNDLQLVTEELAPAVQGNQPSRPESAPAKNVGAAGANEKRILGYRVKHGGAYFHRNPVTDSNELTFSKPVLMDRALAVRMLKVFRNAWPSTTATTPPRLVRVVCKPKA
jgi:hypothetical protein